MALSGTGDGTKADEFLEKLQGGRGGQLLIFNPKNYVILDLYTGFFWWKKIAI